MLALERIVWLIFVQTKDPMLQMCRTGSQRCDRRISLKVLLPAGDSARRLREAPRSLVWPMRMLSRSTTLAMELVDGRTLGEWRQEQSRFSPLRVFPCFREEWPRQFGVSKRKRDCELGEGRLDIEQTPSVAQLRCLDCRHRVCVQDRFERHTANRGSNAPSTERQRVDG